MTDAERAMELAEWNESLSQSLVPNSMADHRHRDTSRLLREYAGMAERVEKLEEVLRSFPGHTTEVAWNDWLFMRDAALAPPAKEPADAE